MADTDYPIIGAPLIMGLSRVFFWLENKRRRKTKICVNVAQGSVNHMVPTVMESHGKWRVMEKSWNFSHLFSEKNSWAAKINKTDGKSRVWQKMQPKCAIFRQKSQKFSAEWAQPPTQTLPPLGREIPLTRPLTLGIYLCTYFFCFFGGIARIKVVMEKH